jgi:hypothetical protein
MGHLEQVSPVECFAYGFAVPSESTPQKGSLPNKTEPTPPHLSIKLKADESKHTTRQEYVPNLQKPVKLFDQFK